MRALLGGTFDPPHAGHLYMARALEELAGVEGVWWIPAHLPPHKDEPGAGPWHRFAMTALACAALPRQAPLPVELVRGGASYTIDTLAALDPDGKGVLLGIGADSLAGFPDWRAPREILERAALAVFPRDGAPAFGEILAASPDWLSGAVAEQSEIEPGRVLLLDRQPPGVSSTELRRALARGDDPGETLVPLVREYIGKVGLYAAPPNAPTQESPSSNDRASQPASDAQANLDEKAE